MSGCEKRGAFVDGRFIDESGLGGLLGLLFLCRESLFQKEHALDDSQNNANRGHEIWEQIRIPSEQAILGEGIREVNGRSGEKPSHSRSDDTSKGPNKRLGGIGFSCSL